MGKEKRLLPGALIGIGVLGVLALVMLLGGMFFGGENEPSQASVLAHLPQQAHDALEDIATLNDKLETVERGDEVAAIGSCLAALRTSIEQLPAETHFTYGPLLRQEIASLLDRTLAVRRQQASAQGEKSEPTQDASRLDLLVAAQRILWKTVLESNSTLKIPAPLAPETLNSPILAELQKEVEQLRQQVEQQRTDLQRTLLEKEFELDRADINKLLVAFTTPGLTYTTPDGKKDQNDGLPHPVSLGFLKKHGCLQSDRKSLERLLSAASRVKRPRGHLPLQWGGDMSHLTMGIKTVQRAEQLLIKYGDLLIEKGLLSP